jgi:hypothetical protein
MEKKKSVKDTLAELAMMRKASKERQAGKNTTSEDIKARMQKRETDKAKEEAKATKKAAKGGGNKYGPTAMKAGGTARNFAGSGDGEGYTPKTKVDGSAYSGKSPSDSTSNYKEAQGKQAKKNKSAPSAPRQRRATGRSEMMSERQRSVMEREEEKRKRAQEKGGSSVVGS